MDASQIGTNFWDLDYLWYMVGFLLVPRVAMIFILSNYVTDGFRWYNIFYGITIWWMYPVLGLGWLSKVLFFVATGFYPRLLLGIVGYIYLPENQAAMIVFCILGFGIDTAVKFRKQIGQKCFTKKTPSFVEGKTFFEKLDFLYLAFSIIPDGRQSKEETAVRIQKIHEWMKLAKEPIDIESTSKRMATVLVWYNNPEIDRLAETQAVIDNLGANPKFTDLMKQKVLSDLIAIGQADGQFGENEKKLVNLIASSWGVEPPV